jgi:ACS family sodium-dependent inorganic phosphate cotransporter
MNAPGSPRVTSMFRMPQRYVMVLLTFVCTSVCYIERVGFSIAYTAAANDAGVGETVKGQLLSTFFYGYALSQVPGGWAAQRFGGRRVLLFSFVLWSLTSALTPTEADSVTGLVIARLLVGVAQGFIFPSIHTVLAQWVPPHERSRSVSLTTSGMYLGAAAGMLFLPGLVALQGPRAVFLAEAFMGVSWALLWLRYSTNPPRVSPIGVIATTAFERTKLLHPVLDVDENGDMTDKQQKKKKRVVADGIPWRQIMSSLPVWAIIANNFTFHYALYVLMNWLPTYFEKGLNQSLHSMGFSKMLPYLVMFIFSNVGGVVADHFVTSRLLSVTNTRKLLNTVGFAVASMSLLIMPHLRTTTSAVICSSVALGACALSRAGFAVNHMDIAPRYAGIVMGFSNTAGTLAGVVGVAASGRILEASPLGPSDLRSWYMVFATPAMLSVASAILFLVFATGERVFD